MFRNANGKEISAQQYIEACNNSAKVQKYLAEASYRNAKYHTKKAQRMRNLADEVLNKEN